MKRDSAADESKNLAGNSVRVPINCRYDTVPIGRAPICLDHGKISVLKHRMKQKQVLANIEIETMTAFERLELIARLWSSLDPESAILPPLTKEHVAEIDRRLDLLALDPGRVRQWLEAKKIMMEQL